MDPQFDVLQHILRLVIVLAQRMGYSDQVQVPDQAKLYVHYADGFVEATQQEVIDCLKAWPSPPDPTKPALRP